MSKPKIWLLLCLTMSLIMLILVLTSKEAAVSKSDVLTYLLLHAILLLYYLLVSSKENRKLEKHEERRGVCSSWEKKDQIMQQEASLSMVQSELRRTRSVLVAKDRLAVIGELSSGIVHEIQNPLNFVKNFVETTAEIADELQQDLQKSHSDAFNSVEDLITEIQENCKMLNQHSNRIEEIIKSILLHAKVSSDKAEKTNLNELLRMTYKLVYYGRELGKNTDVVVSFSLDANIPPVTLYVSDFSRAVLNLYNNAVYAVHKRAKSENADFSPSVTVASKYIAEENTVTVSVTDNGSGIAATDVKNIFKPFFTTKGGNSGTGVGLSMAYDIITNKHGGSIAVNSQPQLSTEFMIKLPVNLQL